MPITEINLKDAGAHIVIDQFKVEWMVIPIDEDRPKELYCFNVGDGYNIYIKEIGHDGSDDQMVHLTFLDDFGKFKQLLNILNKVKPEKEKLVRCDCDNEMICTKNCTGRDGNM